MRSVVRLHPWLAPLIAGVVAVTSMLATPAHAAKVISQSGQRVPGRSGLIDGSVGGTLKANKWTLTIPAGAFSGSATVTMAEVTATDGLPTVELTISNPALNSFAVPVVLAHKDKGNDAKRIAWWDPVNQVWRDVPGQVTGGTDVTGTEIGVPLYHFSTYSVRGSKAGW